MERMDAEQAFLKKELQARLGYAILTKNGPWVAELMGLGARPTSAHMARAWLEGEVGMVALLSKGGQPFDEACAVGALKREELGRLGKAAVVLGAKVRPTDMPALQAAVEGCAGPDINRVELAKTLLSNADPEMRQRGLGHAVYLGVPEAIAVLAQLGADPNHPIPRRARARAAPPMSPLEACLMAASDALYAGRPNDSWQRAAIALIRAGADMACSPLEERGSAKERAGRVAVGVDRDPKTEFLIDACGLLGMPELAMECAARLNFPAELQEVASRHPSLASLAEKMSLAAWVDSAPGEAPSKKAPSKSL